MCTGLRSFPFGFHSYCHHLIPRTMEAVVPPQVTAELTQILSNLVLGDNEIRAKYVFSSGTRRHA